MEYTLLSYFNIHVFRLNPIGGTMSHVLINKARNGARNRRVGGSLLSVVFGGGGCGGGCGAGLGFYSKDYNVCCLGINQRPQTEDVFPRISNEAQFHY